MYVMAKVVSWSPRANLKNATMSAPSSESPLSPPPSGRGASSLPVVVQRLKEAAGVTTANCESCCHLGSEGDGPEYNGSWPVCDKIERYGFLKSFPFKKEMPCWYPEFWASKFSEEIRTGSDEEHERICAKWHAALAEAVEPSQQLETTDLSDAPDASLPKAP